MRPLRMAILIAALVCSACSNTAVERQQPNRPPETRITSGPPDSSDAVSYRVDFGWSGSDPDGSVDHFDLLVADHPAAWDSITDVSFTIPAPDDPRWSASYAAETTLVVSADTLRLDPRSLPPGEVLEHFFERWHTVFVRAVDDRGRADETPDYRSFNARTLAPTVALRAPVTAGREFLVPTSATLAWSGEDPLDKATVETPLAARWALVPTRKTITSEYVGFPDSLYGLPESRWSPWRDWQAADGSGTSTLLRDLQVRPGDWFGYYLFAVQARDAAGAVTPVFDWQTPGKNNVAIVRVTVDHLAPVVTLSDLYFGTYRFTHRAGWALDCAANQPVHFRWRGDASSYGSQVEGYRYGWDIRNLDQDSEWACDRSATCLEDAGSPRRFPDGMHRFYLQARDAAGQVTDIRIEIRILQQPMSRDLLFVDDTVQPQGPAVELQEDLRWAQAIDSLEARARRAGQPFDFDHSRDRYDVVARQSLPPPAPLIFDYKTVVWTVVQGAGFSAINRLANFFDPFVDRNQNAVVAFNYLTVYIDTGGELWLSGLVPAYTIFDVMGLGPAALKDRLPVNITNWDDRLQPHPEVDSVGVQSFLYRLGVEAVDLGSGSRATERRQTPQHGCLGLERASPSVITTQYFDSDVVLGHTHVVALQPSVFVEAAPAAGLDLTTEPASGHTHGLHLTASNIGGLQVGYGLTLPTSESSGHTHAFALLDRSGPGGAPAWLAPNPATWPLPPFEVNPLRTRSDVEIFNMPRFLASQSPPLAPPSWRVLVLYTYRSGVREDPSRGLVYPLTADRQPVVLVAKRAPDDVHYSRAIAGFEPWRLTFESHVRLAETILLHHFGLGAP